MNRTEGFCDILSQKKMAAKNVAKICIFLLSWATSRKNIFLNLFFTDIQNSLYTFHLIYIVVIVRKEESATLKCVEKMRSLMSVKLTSQKSILAYHNHK